MNKCNCKLDNELLDEIIEAVGRIHRDIDMLWECINEVNSRIDKISSDINIIRY
jgi:uncharacterized protein YwgA